MRAHISVRYLMDRSDISKIAEQMPIVPDEVWHLGPRTKKGGRNKQDGFAYQSKDIEITYLEYEVNVVLSKAMVVKDAIDHLVGSDNYEVMLCLGVYCEDQANPGIHLNPAAVDMLNKLRASVDLDLYKS